jgi:pyruvate/2-oxoglutarate dehydrogenase complex dihydrolipoamide acyltransferase (E2) component
MAEASAPSEPQVTPLRGMRGAVARAMQAAWQAPRVAVALDVSFEACRAAQRERAGLSPTHFVLRAAALGLREHPALNGWVKDDAVHRSAAVDIGLAVNVDGGVVVPVLRAVDEKPIDAVAAGAAELAAQAREGSLSPAAQQGAGFTLTTLGSTGITWFTPILHAPQIAILGVGAVRREPVVIDEEVVPASIVTLTLVFDHRAVDGHPAAQFLATVGQHLEQPAAVLA